MAGDEDEDLDWEDWLDLSDAQQDAILDREMSEYAKWFNSLTPLRQYRYRRQRGLEACLGWRRNIKEMDVPVFHEHLRASQRLLLKMRADFFYGVQGGVQ